MKELLKKLFHKLLDVWYGMLPILLLLGVPLAICVALGWKSIPGIIGALARLGGGSWFIGALLVLFGAIGFINITAAIFNQAEMIGKKYGRKAFGLYLTTTFIGLVALTILSKRS